MKKYFKITHSDGPPGLCVFSGSEVEIENALAAVKLVLAEGVAVEIEPKDARKVRSEIARYEAKRWKAQRAMARAEGEK